MKRVLITGITGFIGGALYASLQKEHVQIFALVRKNILDTKDDFPGVHLLNGSLESISEDQLNENKIDVVFHLAWEDVSNVKLESHLQHIEIQKKFISTVIKSNVKKIIISGSCFEYGRIEGELTVSVQPNPITNYGIAKNNLKNWLHDEWRNSDKPFSVSWLRVFYAFGENQHPRSLYSQLLNAIQNGKNSFDMSRGFQIRDFIHVMDVAKRILEEVDFMGIGFRLINVCSGNPMSVREFVERIIVEKRVDMQLNLSRFPIPDYEPIAFWGNKDFVLEYLKS